MANPAYSIHYEDDALLAVNKLAPLPVQRDANGTPGLQDLMLAERASSLLKNTKTAHGTLKENHNSSHPFLEAVHRIDQRATGLVLFAKTPEALRRLSECFRNQHILKIYLACVERKPDSSSGSLSHWLVPQRYGNKVQVFSSLEDIPQQKRRSAKLATLAYELAGASDRYWFLRIELHTGRRHQIRAQLAAQGWPIKGDLKYGSHRSVPSGRILLHSWIMEFPHPIDGHLLRLTAPLPEDEPLYRVLQGILRNREDAGNG
ncbi:MAG: RNA pseudouridine synthase [Spirochaetaceae bacterium]|nr:RNA pseudouridine synthase [Spirochaetaceae bacterium]